MKSILSLLEFIIWCGVGIVLFRTLFAVLPVPLFHNSYFQTACYSAVVCFFAFRYAHRATRH